MRGAGPSSGDFSRMLRASKHSGTDADRPGRFPLSASLRPICNALSELLQRNDRNLCLLYCLKHERMKGIYVYYVERKQASRAVTAK